MDDTQLKTALQLSISHYSRMVTMLGGIEEEIGTAAHDTLQKMNTLLGEMQAEAKATDQLILSLSASTTPPAGDILALMDERAKVINSLLFLNRNVTIKAMGVKSLLAHEIGTLRSGKSALNGYRLPQQNQGRIINRAL